ncbi:putative quinol monooxygenase [Aspergillus ibericus CBS 121593]|uniref:ABM domain-containing protein n=1 Tax=Aspergillus ibericus CBS 121593 TaxID=1448316 RepID=A0A395GKS5_9EURO|nr:hypothetical protein BO80DRAFT_469100 [Aspergillus ibericus CBS 121593]RAK95866.1 hypothetical protein BO80DRAFT_469100 [Aspergillus ibericus CBS 121593]
MAEIHLIATLRPAPGKAAEVHPSHFLPRFALRRSLFTDLQLRQILCETAENVEQLEPSCLTFLLTECRRPDDTIEFKVIERWASQEALEQHQHKSWLRTMYTAFDERDLLAGPEEIEMLKVISGFTTR